MVNNKESGSRKKKSGGEAMDKGMAAEGNGRKLIREDQKLSFHLRQVLEGERRFETAAKAVLRMILEKPVKKRMRSGQIVYDYEFFRQDKRHIVGWFHESHLFVEFLRAAAQHKGEADQMAYVWIGEPGNGKTFTVKYICAKYRQFLARPENRRYTFEFVNLGELGTYGSKLHRIQSQTFEDPMILAMNLFDSRDENIKFLGEAGFTKEQIEALYEDYRPLGACSGYIWYEIRDFFGGDMEKMLEFVRVVPVPVSASYSVITGKYSAGDKITSSATELRGEEDITRLLNLADSTNPYRLDVRKGALARVGGGGIHFADEIFKNKPDLVQIYLGVIQDRTIELEGYVWPLDCLIICTSNTYEFSRFFAEKEQEPLRDRFKRCFLPHNTDYKLQRELTRYALGIETEKGVVETALHEDPNLNDVYSTAVALTRIPHSEKLNPIDAMKLEAGEEAGDKSVETLIEIKDTLNTSSDVTKRWGQKGLGHRVLARAIQEHASLSESIEGKCLYAKDAFKALERAVYDEVSDANDRAKYLKDIKIARQLYRERIKTSIYNAYREDPDAIRKDVMAYINMIIGMTDDQLGPDNTWRYLDPQTHGIKAIKINEKYVDAVEERMGLTTHELREKHRNTMRQKYAVKRNTDPNYDFMDQESLVKAVTEVKTESDVAGEGSLTGALGNQTNEENVQLRGRVMKAMREKLGYCSTCDSKTIEDYCTKEDES